MIRRVLLTAALVACASPLHAQNAAQTPAAPASTVEFIPRADFYLGGERLTGIANRKYRWEGDIGGDIDLLDYGRGRLAFVGNYQVDLGDELRNFDPNQGNYILEGSASARLPPVEAAFVFYHQSRHLSDRPKGPAVDWNMLGARARRAFSVGTIFLDARVDARGAIKRSFVDYRWEVDARLRGDRLIQPTFGLFFETGVRHFGTDGSRGRDGVTGFHVEAGARVDGVVGAVELFVGAERRIDPYPLEFGTVTWGMAGFRVVSR